MICPEKFLINDYLNQNFECSCKREHSTVLKEVEISENALEKVPDLIRKYGYQNAFVVCDKHTYQAAGKKLMEIIKRTELDAESFVFEEEELVPDERALGEMVKAYKPVCDLIIGVGTGTINDLCKFFSYKLNMDYYIVATAPSMDGFASVGAALITDHMKTTYDTHVAKAIIGDVNVLKQAPMNMITAGVGDILGKYICLVDWKISHLITGEYYCETIVAMVRRSIREIVDNMDKIKNRDGDAIKNIMEALTLTGIAMSFVGNSRPASGSEHHLSHYWEMMFLFSERKPVLHGTKVGIGTVCVLKLYDYLKKEKINFENAKKTAGEFSIEKWSEDMKKLYGKAYEGVIKLENEVHKNAPEQVWKRIRIMEEKWDEIMKVIEEELPKKEEVEHMLRSIGASVRPEEEGIEKELVKNSVVAAKELRNRYGLLQLLFDLGLSEKFGERLMND
jgi:glycerol-1-phosphate dehydrogenase [NAD(P)+]